MAVGPFYKIAHTMNTEEDADGVKAGVVGRGSAIHVVFSFTFIHCESICEFRTVHNCVTLLDVLQ